MIRSFIYDTLILRLTSRWYAEVLERVPEGAALLDVGIGTAGALLANADLVRRKSLRVVGIDIDADYVARARKRLGDSPLTDVAEVRLESVYDHRDGPYDAVYFSGSFMLLPEPERALRHCRALLSPGGRIFFTQTIQKERTRWMEMLKPLLKRVTSIDFGRVTYEDDFRAQIRVAGLELEELTTLSRHGSRASCIAVAGSPSTGAAEGYATAAAMTRVFRPARSVPGKREDVFEDFSIADFWEDSDYARAEYIEEPPGPETIAAVERALGYRLPASYVALARVQNGGIPKRTSHRTAEPTSWAPDHVAITGIFAIGGSKRSALLGEFGSRFLIEEWGYPDIGVYFADCPSAGHDMLCLDYRACGPEGEPCVVHVDQELDYKITFVAPTFEAFVRGLEDDDAFDID